MANKFGLDIKHFNRPRQYSRETLVEQLLWLIKLRWVTCVGIVATGLIIRLFILILLEISPLKNSHN